MREAERYLLDSSALFTLIENEAGAERVEEVLREATVFIPWLCLVEVHYVTQQERGVEEANRRYAFLKALSTTTIWESDEALLLRAARFKAGRRLSLADAVIGAYAVERDATLIHKDPEYEALTGEVKLEPLPYRK